MHLEPTMVRIYWCSFFHLSRIMIAKAWRVFCSHKLSLVSYKLAENSIWLTVWANAGCMNKCKKYALVPMGWTHLNWPSPLTRSHIRTQWMWMHCSHTRHHKYVRSSTCAHTINQTFFLKKKLNNQTSSQRITRIYYTEHCRWQGNACVRHQNIELAVDRSCCSCRQEEHGGQHKQPEGKGEKQAPVIRNVPDSGCGLLNLCRSTENFTWLV